MQLQLTRHDDNNESTIGTLKVDNKIECFTLEDTFNEPKIYGKTRIPVGSYEITLRKEGSMNLKYSDRYLEHKGMLWLRNVNNFEWVYIHVGNDADDTDGCILVGSNWDIKRAKITGSSLAYKALYEKVVNAIDAGYPVNIEII